MREALRVMLVRLLAVVLITMPPAKAAESSAIGSIEVPCAVQVSSCCESSRAPVRPCHRDDASRECGPCVCGVQPLIPAFVRPAAGSIVAGAPLEGEITDRGEFLRGRVLEPPSPIPIHS